MTKFKRWKQFGMSNIVDDNGEWVLFSDYEKELGLQLSEMVMLMDKKHQAWKLEAKQKLREISRNKGAGMQKYIDEVFEEK